MGWKEVRHRPLVVALVGSKALLLQAVASQAEGLKVVPVVLVEPHTPVAAEAAEARTPVAAEAEDRKAFPAGSASRTLLRSLSTRRIVLTSAQEHPAVAAARRLAVRSAEQAEAQWEAHEAAHQVVALLAYPLVRGVN